VSLADAVTVTTAAAAAATAAAKHTIVGVWLAHRRDTLFSKTTRFSRPFEKLTGSMEIRNRDFLGHVASSVVGQQGRWLGWQNTTMLDTWAKTAIFFVRLSLPTHPSIHANLL